MSQEPKSFHAYAKELLDAYASREIENIVTPYGENTTALRVASHAHFTELLRKFMIGEGMVKHEDFSVMDHDDPKIFGSRAYIYGIFREDQDRRFEARRKIEDDRSEAIRIAAKESDTWASVRNMDPANKAKLIAELRAGKKNLDPAEVARSAAADTRRIILGDQ